MQPKRPLGALPESSGSNWAHAFVSEEMQDMILQLVSGINDVTLVCKSWYNTVLARQTTSPVNGRDLVTSFPLVDCLQMAADVLFNPETFFHVANKDKAAEVALDILTHESNTEVAQEAIRLYKPRIFLFLVDAYNQNRRFFGNFQSKVVGENSNSHARKCIKYWSGLPHLIDSTSGDVIHTMN